MTEKINECIDIDTDIEIALQTIPNTQTESINNTKTDHNISTVTSANQELRCIEGCPKTKPLSSLSVSSITSCASKHITFLGTT